MSLNQLYISAAKRAEKIRHQLSLSSFEPLNIFDVCQRLDVTVRFIDINMEGMYITQSTGKHPTILLSNQRPMPRRVYTCAHELGHHIFEHGSKMDMLSDHNPGNATYNYEERLVDTFAGILLMPIASIQAEFNRRRWTLESATQLNYYIISSFFGVGYQTLIKHCRLNGIISEAKATALLKTTPAKLLGGIESFTADPAAFKIFDGVSVPKTIDLEVSNYLLIPEDTSIEGNHLQLIGKCSFGKILIAKKPGIVRMNSLSQDFGAFMRIQNSAYVGLSENRHLDND